MKILLIALSGIGDALMFTPSLSLLKEEYPASEIDALVMFKGVSDIYKNDPHISKIHFWDFLNKSKLESLAFVLGLRKKYDVTINIYPANRKEYNLISFLIGSPKRLAVEYLRVDKQNFGFLNNIRVPEDDSLHNVVENVRMIEKLTGKKYDKIPPLQLNLGKDDKEYADEYIKTLKLSKDFIVGIHPGCAALKNHTRRRWEPEKFAGLAAKLIEDFDVNIFLFGGPEENELKASIKKQINSSKVFSINTQSLMQTAAIIEHCSLFITNDSALMHVAAGLQRKIISIIGPTNWNYIHPWQTESKMISLNLDCSPCFHYSPKPLMCSRNDVKFKCIKELEVDIVYNEAAKYIRR